MCRLKSEILRIIESLSKRRNLFNRILSLLKEQFLRKKNWLEEFFFIQRNSIMELKYKKPIQ